MSEETPALEEAQASDAQTEEVSGSEHFAIGDLPPGVESAETDSAATEEVSGDAPVGDVDVAALPPEHFWSFKTADGQEKTFASQEDAQQFFSSWNGRLSKAERELNEVTSLNYKWQQAYESGELGGDPVPETAELADAANEAARSGALEPHDWAAVAQYIKNGEGEKALQYIQWRNGEYLTKQVEGLRQEVVEAFQQQAAPAQFQSQVSEAMTYVAQAGQAAVNDMGEPMFPEFQEGPSYNRDFVMHFRNIWLGQDYRLATDPNGQGFKSAYYEAKATYKEPVQETQPVTETVTPATAPAAAVANAPRNPDGTFAKRNQALSMSDTDVAASGTPGGPAPPKAGIVEQMRDVGTSRSRHFAVAPD
jgi:hypothetical protein